MELDIPDGLLMELKLIKMLIHMLVLMEISTLSIMEPLMMLINIKNIFNPKELL
jgi:hypothetical protein